MKFTVLGFLLAFSACFCLKSYAQDTQSSLRGKVLTDSNLPAESATVLLLKYADSSIIKSTVVGKDGLFKILAVVPEKYLLLVRKIGYSNNYSGPYQLVAGQVLLINDITINAVTQQLSEVSVASNKPEVEVKPGRIVLNVQNNIMASGASVFDVLRQSPGVRVDNNNNVSIIGRQGALITIDGKPTSLSGDDLAAVLKSMPSNTVDRIELITGGSAKYDASSGGIINIISKKGSNVGANATITLGAGYGKYAKDNAGIVFNDRTEHFNVFGNYNYSENKTFHDFTTDRNINFDNVLSDYHVDYHGLQTNFNNGFSFGTDFYLSKKQTLGFLLNGSVIDDSFKKDNNLKIYNQSALDSVITATSKLNRHIKKFNYNINYSAKLDSAGTTLTANFDYNTYDRQSSEYITNTFYNADGNTYRAPLLLQNISPSTIHIWIGKVDFSDPLTKTSKLEAGFKYSKVTSNNDLTFGPLVNGSYTSDPNFTNHFLYTENVNAAYVNYSNKFDKTSLEVGVRAEQTIAKGNSVTLNQIVNSNYTNLFPHLLLTYTKDDKNEYTLDFSRGITRPGYEVLNPFLYYTDLYDYRSGNPYLKPEFSNSLELSYTYNQSLVTTLYATVLTDAYNFNVYEQNDTSKVNITTNKNLGRIYNYGLRFTAPVTFTNWWNANFFVDASYQRYVAYPQNGNLNKGTQDIILQTTQNFIISKSLTAVISARYESPSFYGVNQFKANYYVDGGLSKQLFNKRGTLKLSVADIFNTLRDRAQTNYQNLNLSIVDKKESQIGRITFTYRFGKTSLKTITHHTGNEEEQKRTGSTN
jgi:hypothetical protein